MTLRLIDLEAPLDDVEFPDGTKHVPVPWGPAEYRAWRDVQTETDATARGKLILQIVRACYPAVPDDELYALTPRMLFGMAAHAGGKIEQVKDALKNGDAAAAPASPPPPATAPSSPTPSGNTSSRPSRRRSGKTGGPSTTAVPTASPT